jgi:alkylation response protein AidB-like acyl-CoA dehydrogenase
MDLEFTDDQLELRDSVRDVLDKECPTTVARAITEGTGADSRLWDRMVELGWPGLTIPEEHGGLGLSFVDAALVIEEMGRHLAPGPYLASVTQFAPVVRELGTTEQRARWLGGVASGEVIGTLAIADGDGRYELARGTVDAQHNGHGYVVSGARHFVLDADAATVIATVVRLDDAIGVLLVDRDQVTIEPVDTIDRTMPLATVSLDGASIPPDRLLTAGADTEALLTRALEEAIVAIALTNVGACQAIFDIDLEYAKVREQFGVPIGSFQAVKHKLTNMYVALEKARSVAYFAALAITENDERRALASSIAKAAAGDCQQLLTQDGLQLMGAIGFTWEHDLHLFMRRAKTLEPLFGTTPWHRARVAERIGL